MRIWSSDMWHVAEACVDWDCVVEEGDRGVTHSSERSEAGAAAGAEREGTPVREEREERGNLETRACQHNIQAWWPEFNLFLVNGWDCEREWKCACTLQLAKEVQILTRATWQRCCVFLCISLICWLCSSSRAGVRAGSCRYCWLPLWEFWAGENMRVPLNHYTESIIDLNDFQG